MMTLNLVLMNTNTHLDIILKTKKIIAVINACLNSLGEKLTSVIAKTQLLIGIGTARLTR